MGAANHTLTRSHRGFSPEKLLEALPPIEQGRRLWVAYSGGRDSHVLLHALAQLRPRLPEIELRAAHVDHGLSPNSRQWSQHCQIVCADLEIPLETLVVNAMAQAGESPEAAARDARYQAFSTLIDTADYLLTAHHQDDQAETLMIQLLRGAGPQGLAAMPSSQTFARGRLLRPLLGFTRDELKNYAEQQGLHWIEDESNFDTGFDRNYLRHRVMLVLQQRWPAVAKTLTRSAENCGEAAHLLDAMAAEDLERIQGSTRECISVSQLLVLDEIRQRNLLRYWIRQLGLPLPSAIKLHHVQTDVLQAATDGSPCVQWSGAELRRYRDGLYAMQPLPRHDPDQMLEWDLKVPLTLPDGSVLSTKSVVGSGIDPLQCQGTRVTVRFRQGGERCQPAGCGITRTLKNLLQEHDVPPWLRDRLPLIYVDDSLAAVVGIGICEPFQVQTGNVGTVVKLHSS